MIPEKEQFEELCSAYALGALPPDEVPMLNDALVNGGPEYQKIYQDALNVTYLINTSLTRRTPPPEVKQRLMKRITSRSVFDSLADLYQTIALFFGFGNPRFGFTVAFIFICSLAAAGSFAYQYYNDLLITESHVAELEKQVNAQQLRLVALTDDLQRKEAILNVLQSPKIEMVLMSGLETNPAGYGKIIWDPVRKIAILQVAQLPAVPTDKDYQLWFLDKDKHPVSAGIFALAETNENYFSVSEMPLPDDKNQITAFAVTVEPKGGVPQPTGAMVLLGAPSSVH